jgi:hypothetical protein
MPARVTQTVDGRKNFQNLGFMNGSIPEIPRNRSGDRLLIVDQDRFQFAEQFAAFRQGNLGLLAAGLTLSIEKATSFGLNADNFGCLVHSIFPT